mmetsp:Transcript_38997/g.50425  ORF Transcript_38997/g.50425 Transcript_38997/m.50425 type:complete len:321 (+) Transcript_38997:90-1052(+)
MRGIMVMFMYLLTVSFLGQYLEKAIVDAMNPPSNSHSFVNITTLKMKQRRRSSSRRLTIESSPCVEPNSNHRQAVKIFLGVAIIIKDEKDLIEEWARHYLSEGVERFYMIDQESYWVQNNRQQNGHQQRMILGKTAQELERIIPNKTTHFVAPSFADMSESKHAVNNEAGNERSHLSVANMPNMAPSYRMIVNKAKSEGCKWLMFVDSDEYMYASSPHDTINSVITRLSLRLPNMAQISVPWTMMGSSGHAKMPKCTIRSFTWAWHREINDPTPVKSILRLEAMKNSARVQVHRQTPQSLCPNWKSVKYGGGGRHQQRDI